MTEASPAEALCVICGRAGTAPMAPPRRTLARGADPDDASYSIIAVLPDVALCAEHFEDVRRGELSIGWCDAEQCRLYGEHGQPSPCGEPFKTLKR
ncbi:MAG: hypothetical protein M0Z69_06890 [Actinomycetota bacterium]|nr:hypothetical protein [Actinomycetota bacterium]MDA8038878.1 hypothetical protein [Actinomycetota bacterium]